MALTLDDAEADSLARQVESLTGETLTEAVRSSLAERLVREQLKRGQTATLVEAVENIVGRYRSLPVLDPRSDDAIIGFDETGLPS